MENDSYKNIPFHTLPNGEVILKSIDEDQFEKFYNSVANGFSLLYREHLDFTGNSCYILSLEGEQKAKELGISSSALGSFNYSERELTAKREIESSLKGEKEFLAKTIESIDNFKLQTFKNLISNNPLSENILNILSERINSNLGFSDDEKLSFLKPLYIVCSENNIPLNNANYKLNNEYTIDKNVIIHASPDVTVSYFPDSNTYRSRVSNITIPESRIIPEEKAAAIANYILSKLYFLEEKSIYMNDNVFSIHANQLTIAENNFKNVLSSNLLNKDQQTTNLNPLSMENNKLTTNSSVDVYPNGNIEILIFDKSSVENASELMGKLDSELKKLPEIINLIESTNDGNKMVILNNIKENNKPLQEHIIKTFDSLSINYLDTPLVSLRKSILSNPNHQTTKTMENLRIGTAKLHTFSQESENPEKNNTVFNLTVFDKEIQKVLPEQGKLRLFVQENPNDPDKMNIVAARTPDDIPNTRLVLDLNSDYFNKSNDELKLKVNDGYIDLVASKMTNKDSYSVYQHFKGESNKYVGFASEPSNGILLGTVFENKTNKSFEFLTALINPVKLDTDKHSFININRPSEEHKNMIAFSHDRPLKNSEVIIQLSDKGKDFLNSLPNNDDIRITIAGRKEESITPSVNFSDKNVFVYNKDTKEKFFIGSAWSKEQFNSLTEDIQKNISSAGFTKPEMAESNALSKGDIIQFTVPNDFFLNVAVEKGLSKEPVAVGTVSSVVDNGNISVAYAGGNAEIAASDPSIKRSDAFSLGQFEDSYTMIKNEVSKSSDIKPIEKKNSPKAEKAKGATKSKTTGKAKSSPGAKASVPSKSQKTKTSKAADKGMSM